MGVKKAAIDLDASLVVLDFATPQRLQRSVLECAHFQIIAHPYPGSHTSSHHLRQRGLCLGQPEVHLHRSIQLDSRTQGGTGLLLSSHPAVQGAETAVAVGLEWAHA